LVPTQEKTLASLSLPTSLLQPFGFFFISLNIFLLLLHVWIPPEKGEKKGKSEGLVLQFSLGPKKVQSSSSNGRHSEELHN
jgi:hypothetical protein